jgi:hypothetical protein
MATIINASTSAGLIQTADTSGTLQLQSNGVTQQTIDSTGSYGQLARGTAQASTSGTSITFSSIPSWVKRITVMFNGVSTSGSSYIRFQLGTGGTPTTTGYAATASTAGPTWGGSGSSTSGFDSYGDNNASWTRSGAIVFTNITGNTWICSGSYQYTAAYQVLFSGVITLGGVLNMVRITTVNGTDTFTAGSINILYEG